MHSCYFCTAALKISIIFLILYKYLFSTFTIKETGIFVSDTVAIGPPFPFIGFRNNNAQKKILSITYNKKQYIHTGTYIYIYYIAFLNDQNNHVKLTNSQIFILNADSVISFAVIMCCN